MLEKLGLLEKLIENSLKNCFFLQVFRELSKTSFYKKQLTPEKTKTSYHPSPADEGRGGKLGSLEKLV